MKTPDELTEPYKGNGETLLIIDDEPSFVEVTTILLELAGYQVIFARDGLDGIRCFEENKEKIAAVICDLNMPKLGGHAAIHTFLTLKPGIKILVISGSIMEEDMPTYLIPGEIEFLRKPFLTEKLLETLQFLLGNSGKKKEPS
ncbi:MAG: response regulator [Bacteroidota bacterium]